MGRVFFFFSPSKLILGKLHGWFILDIQVVWLLRKCRGTKSLECT